MSQIGLTLALLFNILLMPHPLHNAKIYNSEAYSETSIAHQADFDCATIDQIPAIDCAALVQLYTATNGDNWLNNEGWLQNDQPCQWHGIVCDRGTAVTRIFLDGNQLTGFLPPEIGNFASLTWLQLNDNQLTGTIPIELGKLDQVTWLRLESNQLSGSIPAALSKMTALESLYLSNNPLTGTIPPELGTLPTLYKLYLGGTQLSGPLSPELGNLSTLEFLIIDDTNLSGPLPSTFTQLENLTFFQLQRTNLCQPQDQALQRWLAGISDLYADDIFCTDNLSASTLPQPTLSQPALPQPIATATDAKLADMIGPQTSPSAPLVNNLTLITVTEEITPFFSLVWKDSPGGAIAPVDLYAYDASNRRNLIATNKWDNSSWLDRNLLFCKNCGARSLALPNLGQIDLAADQTLFELLWRGTNSDNTPLNISTFGTVDTNLKWSPVTATSAPAVPQSESTMAEETSAANERSKSALVENALLENGLLEKDLSERARSTWSAAAALLALLILLFSGIYYGWRIGQYPQT